MENGQRQERRATHKLEISVLPVSFNVYIESVKKAWESVSQDIVIKSFRCCGIPAKVDGTEDKEIHCIKDGGIAAEAFAEIYIQLLFWQPTRVTVRVMTLLETLMRMKVNWRKLSLKMMLLKKMTLRSSLTILKLTCH